MILLALQGDNTLSRLASQLGFICSASSPRSNEFRLLMLLGCLGRAQIYCTSIETGRLYD